MPRLTKGPRFKIVGPYDTDQFNDIFHDGKPPGHVLMVIPWVSGKFKVLIEIPGYIISVDDKQK